MAGEFDANSAVGAVGTVGAVIAVSDVRTVVVDGGGTAKKRGRSRVPKTMVWFGVKDERRGLDVVG